MDARRHVDSKNTGKAIDQTTLDFSYYINNPMQQAVIILRQLWAYTLDVLGSMERQ